MNKKKKVFILSLALSLMTIGVIASASTRVRSEGVNISFNVLDYEGTYVMGYGKTGTITTQNGSYLESHYGLDTRFQSGAFYCELVSVKPWYQPNTIKDRSTTIGTFASQGWNRGHFDSNETLRTDMGANGVNGYSMTEQSGLDKE